MRANSSTENFHKGGCKLVRLNRKEQRRAKKRYWIIRRGQDIFFSALALLLLLPLMVVLALVIYIDDPHGSPVFSQIRCGRDGKLFKMYKFRSMMVNAPDIRLADGSTYNGEDDPRVTKIGRFMRVILFYIEKILQSKDSLTYQSHFHKLQFYIP